MQKPLAKSVSLDVHGTMSRARAAQKSIRSLSLAERVARLGKLRGAILDEKDRIVEKIVAETKKVPTDALVSEVFSVLDHLHYLEKNAGALLGDRKVKTPLALAGKKSWIYYEPLGTVLVISPWNYPFYLGVVPCTSAFLAGNAVIFKPSEHTPLEGLLEDLFKRAGFAEDWVQVVYGDGQLARELIDERPDKIFFTGSGATGAKILAQAAPHLIPVTMELGGKDPMIVFEDANAERAAAGALWGGVTNLGQSCTSVERVYVHETIYERFKTALVTRAKALRAGQDLGRMTAHFQVEKISRQVAEAQKKGARFLTGGEWDGKSDAIPPMIVEGLPVETALLQEETFGPILPLIPFGNEEEAVRLANDSPYGLSASVWTADLARAERVTRRLEVGNVSVNSVMLTEGNPGLPFGGIKASGFGRGRGETGLHAFCNLKSVLYDKDSKKIEAHWFPYDETKLRLFGSLCEALFRGGGNLFRFATTGLRLERHAARLEKKRAQ